MVTRLPNRQDYPLYAEAVALYVAGRIEDLRRRLAKADFSQNEKLLLRTRLSLHEGESASAEQRLLKVGPLAGVFFEAERRLLLAACASIQGRWRDAALHNGLAFRAYRRCEDRRGQFISSYNLNVDLDNMGHGHSALRAVKRSERFVQTDQERRLLDRALACRASNEGQAELALSCVQRLLDSAGWQSEDIDRLDDLLVCADILTRFGQLERAHQILAALKLRKIPKEKGRIEFERQALKILLNKSSSWKGRTTLGSTPDEYALKSQIAEAWANGDAVRAQTSWEQLHRLLPQEYGSQPGDFSSRQQNSSLARLARKLVAQPRASEPVGRDLSHLPKLVALHQLLLTGQRFRKEDLIEKLWQVSYDPALDARFYKLIERYKRSFPQTELVKINHTYSLAV